MVFLPLADDVIHVRATHRRTQNAMFNDIYATTPCMAYNMASVQAAVKAGWITDAVRPAHAANGKASGTWMVTGEKDIPSFAHPIILNRDGEERIVFDARAFTRIDRATNQVVITNKTEHDFMLLRAQLQEAWTKGQANTMMTAPGMLAAKVFSRWVSEGLARRLNLNPLEQLQCQVIACMYWWQLFGLSALEETDVLKMIQMTGRAIGLSTDKILPITDGLRPMTNIHLFIGQIRSIVNSTRVEPLSVALLYGILGGGWFGANAREIVAVSLEHPPTFLAIVYTALTNRTYNKSFLGQLVQHNDKQDAGKIFINNIDRMIETWYV
jgi:hypothetical protein